MTTAKTTATLRGISILLVDDHPVVRQGYRRVLEHQDDFRVVAEADNAEQRRRRFSFYERSGFRDTGYAVQDSTGEYWTLAREVPGTPFDPDDFRDALHCLDCGLITARVVRRD